MINRTFILLSAYGFTSFASWGAVAAQPNTATIDVAVLYPPKRTYAEIAEAVHRNLSARGRSCELIELPPTMDKAAASAVRERIRRLGPAVLATGGASTTSFALESTQDIPVVFFMVPNALDASFLAEANPHRSRVAGITSDIAYSDQINWILTTQPDVRELAILYSPRSRRTANALRAAARAAGIRCVTIPASRNAFPDAIHSLDQIDPGGVLMIPDAQVYSGPAIRRLLLWGISHRKAVWTFSDNLVKAGALAGLAADYQAVGRQAAELVVRALDGTPATRLGLHHPSHVRQSVNVHTAEFVGVSFNGQRVGAEAIRYGDER